MRLRGGVYLWAGLPGRGSIGESMGAKPEGAPALRLEPPGGGAVVSPTPLSVPSNTQPS